MVDWSLGQDDPIKDLVKPVLKAFVYLVMFIMLVWWMFW